MTTPADPGPSDPSSEPTLPATAPDLVGAHELASRIRSGVRRAVVGQDEVVDEVLVTLIAGGHALLEGVPGLGKTLLVLALARTFGGRFSRVQFTPDLMPTDVVGHAVYDMNSGSFRIRRGPAFTNLLLADEINRAPAKTQAALLEVMQEQQITIEGEGMALSPPFMVLATQNPVEQEGTYPLPEAQLDRFLLKIQFAYPSEREEVDLVRQVTTGQAGEGLDVSAVEEVAKPADVVAMRTATAGLLVDERIHAYAVQIARATRSWQGLSLGSGPRGAIALVRAARAHALLAGRDFVTPDDVKAMAPAALRHRVALSPELAIEGHDVDSVLQRLLEKVDAPRA